MPPDEARADSDMGVRQSEIIGQFFPRPSSRFSSTVDNQTIVRLPIGNSGMRFETAMGLDRSPEFLLYNGIRNLNRVRHVSSVFAKQRTAGWPNDVALLGRSISCPGKRDGLDTCLRANVAFFSRSRPHHKWCIRLHGLGKRDHKRSWFVINTDRPGCIFRLFRCFRCDCGQLVSFKAHPGAVQHIDGMHARHFFSRSCIY